MAEHTELSKNVPVCVCVSGCLKGTNCIRGYWLLYMVDRYVWHWLTVTGCWKRWLILLLFIDFYVIIIFLIFIVMLLLIIVKLFFVLAVEKVVQWIWLISSINYVWFFNIVRFWLICWAAFMQLNWIEFYVGKNLCLLIRNSVKVSMYIIIIMMFWWANFRWLKGYHVNR